MISAMRVALLTLLKVSPGSGHSSFTLKMADDRLVPWPEHSICVRLGIIEEISRSLIALGYQEQSSKAEMSVSTF
jgi:hypothetical protein